MAAYMLTALGSLTLHQIYDYVTGFVFACSILGSFLPPYDWFTPWPKFQAVYRILTMIISRWGAINVKSLIYPSIASTGSANVSGGGGGNVAGNTKQ